MMERHTACRAFAGCDALEKLTLPGNDRILDKQFLSDSYAETYARTMGIAFERT